MTFNKKESTFYKNGGNKTMTFFQGLQIILAIIFIICTLGFVSVYMEWNNGTFFRYRGWLDRRK